MSKRLLSRYVSVNSEPYRLFHGPRKSEPNKLLAKKREEPCLSGCDRQGCAGWAILAVKPRN